VSELVRPAVRLAIRAIETSAATPPEMTVVALRGRIEAYTENLG
jgi:hypothetical protein